MRTYTVKPSTTTDGRPCFVAAFDDLPDVMTQGETREEAFDALMLAAPHLPSAADLLREAGVPVSRGTGEGRRVSDEAVREIAEDGVVRGKWCVGVDEGRGFVESLAARNLARDLQFERAKVVVMDAEVSRLTAEVQRLRGERDRYLHTLNWAMGTTGYFPGGSVHKPYGWREDMKRMAAIRYDGERYVAALTPPGAGVPATADTEDKGNG